MRVLRRIVAASEAIPFALFRSRILQRNIFLQWDRSISLLEHPFLPSIQTRESLKWWLTSTLVHLGWTFPPVHWQVVSTDASPLGWGKVFRHLTVQGRWSRQESSLSINFLELRVVFLALLHWERYLNNQQVRIQTDNATAVAYINHQGGTRSPRALAKVSRIFNWAETAISAVFIPGTDNTAADYPSREGLATGEWSLHQDVFRQICQLWGTPDVNVLASQQNRRVQQFVSRYRDPLTIGVDALVIPWTQFRLPYLFPPLPLLPRLVKKIKEEGVPVILIAPYWPRRAWFAEIINLLAGTPLRLPDRPDLLAQGPFYHPNSRLLNWTAWPLKRY
ncbi:uncharacterized protein [Dendrobates tinctorius]|uniref:uncharacterized protein n=1 Tax=Dendrobates tinctorius TaxID=92724 RepID=UPI003CC92C91